jgi:hypothetical protein
MKKLILLLLFIPLVSFGQDESTINLNVKGESYLSYIKDNGLTYEGLGKYIIKGTKFYGSQKKITERLTKTISEFASNSNANYKILSNEFLKGEFRKVVITFELRNKDDGSLLINKEEAKKELLSLKEYLDLGIITQEEFDKKAVSLKKILLGN